MFVWAAERIPSDQVAAWEDGLGLPLPGDPMEIANEVFDDSYDQINQ